MAETSCKAIKSNVKEYLKARKFTIELKFTAETPSNGLVEQNFPGRVKNGPSFVHNSVTDKGQNVYFLIHFTKLIHPTTTVEELKNCLQFVALDEIPLPDFDYPPGWDITLQTPVSSFKEGVDIVSYEDGKLHYKIDTKFFCVSGHRREPGFTPGGCNPPPPPGSYFDVEKDIHGIIDVNMPLKFL